jgi:ectoine hydroxylase-related dioxygenase (phytanoyl-CoA dioxygenase family)
MKDGKLFIARAGEITFTAHLVARSAYLRDFAAGPVFQDLCHDLVGDDVRLYWDQAVYKKPENPADFPWHQDNGYTFVRPQQYLTCWVSLTDATEENGCPWVVPGIHLSGTLEHEMTDLGWRCLDKPEGATAVPVRAGSIVVFSSLTPHRTGPNTSEGIRKSYILQYAPDGARMVTGSGDTTCDAPDRQFFVLQQGRAPC